ncbi:MAG: Hsp20/alpha crystallin family protein [Acidobacteriota bacterium]
MNWMIQRDPFNELRGIQDDVNRIFNTAFPRLGEERGMEKVSWAPHVDIYEGEQAIVLEADLPGVKATDFTLAVENNILTLSGERRLEKDVKGDRYHRIERQYGRFTRTFNLPSSVNVEKVGAELRDGVLRVTLPKREEVRARQIRVEVKGEATRGAAAS